MNRPPRTRVTLPFLIFAAFMAVVYITLGGIIASGYVRIPQLPESPYRELFGLLIVGYGVFRFYRVWQDRRQEGNGL